MAIDWALTLLTFISTLIATFSGVGLAFWLNRMYNDDSEKTKARRLLFLLKDDIESNLDLLIQLRKDLANPNYTVFYNLRLVVWNSITSNLISVLKNPAIIKDISKFYYELHHVARKVDQAFKLIYSPNLTPDALNRKIELVTSINQHVPGILEGRSCKSPQAILAEIDCLIKELK
ncbi:MAG: hypothetical protein ABIH65_01590 [Nanoarchaeota archaeon]